MNKFMPVKKKKKVHLKGISCPGTLQASVLQNTQHKKAEQANRIQSYHRYTSISKVIKNMPVHVSPVVILLSIPHIYKYLTKQETVKGNV